MAESQTRAGFAASVALGLPTAALAAVASAKPWFRLAVPGRLMPGVPRSETTIDMPLALALSLVVLAGWGAILVSRGVFRRLVAMVAFVALLGILACVASAPFVLPHRLRNQTGLSSHIGVDPTGWFIVVAAASLLAVPALVLAVLRAPRWPTMGSRYDAPATRAAEVADTDLWKALDEGRDPTDLADPPAS